MSVRRRSLRWVLAALAVAVVGLLGVSASALGGSAAADCGSLTIDENAWAGATANVYVVKHVLEKNYGCKVNIAKLPESTPLFQAMADGKVDVLLEDWGNIDLTVNQKYVTSKKLVNLGSNGVIISMIDEVTFFGHDQTGREVSAVGNISIDFGNFADKTT